MARNRRKRETDEERQMNDALAQLHATFDALDQRGRELIVETIRENLAAEGRTLKAAESRALDQFASCEIGAAALGELLSPAIERSSKGRRRAI